MKPRSARGASTRQRIIEAAAKLIYKNGVNGTSVDDVLNASGTGKSQFYHYFTNKDELVRQLIEHYRTTLPTTRQEMLANLSSLAEIERWLDQIVEDHRAGFYRDGCPIGNLASELSSRSEDLRQDLQATFAEWETGLAKGLATMKAKGQLRMDVVPESLAMFALAALEGGMLLAKTEQTSEPLVATVNQIKAHLRLQSIGASRKGGPPKRHGHLVYCP